MTSRLRRLLTALTLLAGVGVCAWLVRATGPAVLWGHVREVGWGILLLLPLSFAWLVPNTLGWARAIPPGAGRVPFWQVFRARLVGESLNLVVPSGQLGGEPVKAAIVARRVGLGPATTSIVVAKTTQTASLLVLVTAGAGLAWFSFALSAAVQGVLLGVTALFGLGVVVLVGASASGLLGRFATWGLARWGEASRFGGVLARLHEVDESLTGFYENQRLRLISSTGWHLAGWTAGTLEVLAVAWLMGRGLPLLDGFVFLAITTLFRVGGFFIPASLGAFEAGHVAAAACIGMPPEVGVSIGFVRRVREIFWIGLGLALLGGEVPETAADGVGEEEAVEGKARAG